MKVRVSGFAVSLDGFAAGPGQDREHPLGINGPDLFQWFFPTQAFRAMQGQEGGEAGIDNRMAERAMEGVGAWILGRNMFGPVRGPWPDEAWQGWWGDEPPYRTKVFVLTHHPRRVLKMKGGTEFHFVTEGTQAALDLAKAAAGDRDVRIGGGVHTVRQYLQARAIDEMHVAVRATLLGAGESLWSGMDLRALGYECTETMVGERATHIVIRRQA